MWMVKKQMRYGPVGLPFERWDGHHVAIRSESRFDRIISFVYRDCLRITRARVDTFEFRLSRKISGPLP